MYSTKRWFWIRGGLEGGGMGGIELMIIVVIWCVAMILLDEPKTEPGEVLEGRELAPVFVDE